MINSYSILTIIFLSITNVLSNNSLPTQTQEKRQVVIPPTSTSRPSSSSTNSNTASTKSSSISVPQTAA